MNQFDRSLRTLHLRGQESRSTGGMTLPRLSVPSPRTVGGTTIVAARTPGLERVLAGSAGSTAAAASATAGSGAISAPGGLCSQALLNGKKVVEISHNGETYQLRATRHGKLILTK